MFRIIILLLFQFNNIVFADTSPTAIELINRDISTSIFKLKHDVLLYNYLNISNNSFNFDKYFQIENNRTTFAQNHIASSGSQFWNILNHKTAMSNAGLGLYLATDPYISSPQAIDYSGANFGEYDDRVNFLRRY